MPEPNLPKIIIDDVVFYDATGVFKDKSGGAGYTFPARPKSQVTGIAYHHDTAFFADKDKNFNGVTFDEELSRMNAVYQMHTKYYMSGYPAGVADGAGANWNWSGIGYHGYIFPSGRIYLVGPLETMRAHVAYRNHLLTGFVLAGNFTTEEPALGSLLAAGLSLKAMRHYYGNPTLEYRGHRQWADPRSPTSCPGETFASWIPKIGQIASISQPSREEMAAKAIKDALLPNFAKIASEVSKPIPDLSMMHNAAHSLDAQLEWLLSSK